MARKEPKQLKQEQQLLMELDAAHHRIKRLEELVNANHLGIMAARTAIERRPKYGDPAENYERTAQVCSLLLDIDLTPADCAMFMIGVKLAREMHVHSMDNLVDLAGYADVLQKVVDAGHYLQRHEGVPTDSAMQHLEPAGTSPLEEMVAKEPGRVNKADWVHERLRRVADDMPKQERGR